MQCNGFMHHERKKAAFRESSIQPKIRRAIHRADWQALTKEAAQDAEAHKHGRLHEAEGAAMQAPPLDANQPRTEKLFHDMACVANGAPWEDRQWQPRRSGRNASQEWRPLLSNGSFAAALRRCPG